MCFFQLSLWSTQSSEQSKLVRNQMFYTLLQARTMQLNIETIENNYNCYVQKTIFPAEVAYYLLDEISQTLKFLMKTFSEVILVAEILKLYNISAQNYVYQLHCHSFNLNQFGSIREVEKQADRIMTDTTLFFWYN